MIKCISSKFQCFVLQAENQCDDERSVLGDEHLRNVLFNLSQCEKLSWGL